MVTKNLKDYFSFSRGERNGIVFLVCIIFVLITVNIVISLLPEKTGVPEAEIEQVLAEFMAQSGTDNLEDRLANRESQHSLPGKSSSELFQFDPNITSREEWRRLGLKEKQITTIEHYLEKGGRFYKPGDLAKIYGLETETFEKLKPYIRIETSQGKAFSPGEKTVETRFSDIVIIELNSADTADLLPLRGIGPVLSRRILKYRNLLGGYSDKKQLLEVYGLYDETYQEISRYLETDTLLLRKLDLNNSSYSEFIRHPYFDTNHTRTILEYRKDRGSFNSVSELLEAEIVSEETFRKVRPYIFVDNQ